MSFTLPDLVIEGAVRKGFDFLRENAGIAELPASASPNSITFPNGTSRASIYVSGPSSSINSLEFSAIIRVPNFASLTSVDQDTLVYINNDGFTEIIVAGAAMNASLVGTSVGSISGEISFFNATVVGTQLHFSFDFIGTSVANVQDYVNNNFPSQSFNIAGTAGIPEVIGAGGEVLNMLFNFEEGGNNIDGGLDLTVSRKYIVEPLRLREFFRNNQVAIVQSFSDIQTNLPCISIQLANDGEDQGLALTDDFGGIEGFDANNGIGRDENTIHANTVINVGIHTKDQLLTKYIYHITKYFILSAKEDLIRQNFIIATFKGSDFSRDAGWAGDHVYTRFLNISGKTEDSWVNLDEIVTQLADVGINIFVPQVGTPASIGPGANQTPAQDVGGNNFVNSSPIFSNVMTADASLQLPNSLYHTGNGMAVFIQRDGTGRQLFQSTPFNIVENNKKTSTLSAVGILPTQDNTGSTTYVDGRGNTQPVAYVSDTTPAERVDQRILEVFEPATGITSPVSTVQTPPSTGLVSSQPKQNINDEDGILHRSDVNENDF